MLHNPRMYYSCSASHNQYLHKDSYAEKQIMFVSFLSVVDGHHQWSFTFLPLTRTMQAQLWVTHLGAILRPQRSMLEDRRTLRGQSEGFVVKTRTKNTSTDNGCANIPRRTVPLGIGTCTHVHTTTVMKHWGGGCCNICNIVNIPYRSCTCSDEQQL